MSFLLDKLAAAAADATAPQQPQAAGGAAGMDPNMDPNMMQPMDPIEEDNQRLTNILENLRLRQEIVQAHAELDALSEEQAKPKKSSAPADPDAPKGNDAPSDQVMSASAIKDILKRTPQVKVDSNNITSGKKNRQASDTEDANTATAPGRADSENLKADPTTIG